jgi:hypothetical protein
MILKMDGNAEMMNFNKEINNKDCPKIAAVQMTLMT